VVAKFRKKFSSVYKGKPLSWLAEKIFTFLICNACQADSPEILYV
jgi:hypothetical protein